MKVLQITLLCLCLFLISSVTGLKPDVVHHKHPCIPNPCKSGKCVPLPGGKYFCAGGCPYNGMLYIPGATFCIHCNLCVCHSNGLISCKKGQCCKYKGKYYKPGAVIVVNGRKYRCINGKWVWTFIKYDKVKEDIAVAKLA